MAKDKKVRDKAAEKAVKARLQQTHLKSVRILGSEVKDEAAVVYILRMVENDNYLFKVNCRSIGNRQYEMSGFIPVTDSNEYGEYRVYNPKPASADALKPAGKEKNFKGYSK